MQSRHVISISREIPRAQRAPYGAVAEHFGRIELLGESEVSARAKAREVARRFPTSEGFKVELLYWQASGRAVDFQEVELV
jgi:hypothetical protein